MGTLTDPTERGPLESMPDPRDTCAPTPPMLFDGIESRDAQPDSKIYIADRCFFDSSVIKFALRQTAARAALWILIPSLSTALQL